MVFLADLNRSFNRQDLDRPVLVHPQLGVGAERVEVERRLRYDTVSKTALALTLEREAKAEELRIQNARKLSEEATTKLLLPMVMLLVVVMVMIMVPAFSNAGI